MSPGCPVLGCPSRQSCGSPGPTPAGLSQAGLLLWGSPRTPDDSAGAISQLIATGPRGRGVTACARNAPLDGPVLSSGAEDQTPGGELRGSRRWPATPITLIWVGEKHWSLRVNPTISTDLALRSWEILAQGCSRTNAHIIDAESDDLCRSSHSVSSGARLPGSFGELGADRGSADRLVVSRDGMFCAAEPVMIGE